MPYQDTERRKQAAQKWRIRHRSERAAYMRRYRRARSSGRARGRPRTGSRRPGDPSVLADARATSAPSGGSATRVVPVPTSAGERGPASKESPPEDRSDGSLPESIRGYLAGGFACDDGALGAPAAREIP